MSGFILDAIKLAVEGFSQGDADKERIVGGSSEQSLLRESAHDASVSAAVGVEVWQWNCIDRFTDSNAIATTELTLG